MINEKHHYAAMLEHPHASAILAKHFQPLSWVHCDWLAQVLPEHYPKDPDCIKSNEYVSKQLALTSQRVLDLECDLQRFLLLDSNTIHSVIGLLGLSRYRLALTVLINKHIKTHIDEQLNCHATQIILQKLPFMLAKYPAELLKTTHQFHDLATLPCFISEGIAIFREVAGNTLAFEHLRYSLSDKFKWDMPMPTLTPENVTKIKILIKKLALEVDNSCSSLLK